MKPFKGFTLIELLIALSVFAILATITASVLYHALTIRTRVNQQSNTLKTLQLAISLIQQDTKQIIDRAVRGNDLQLIPLFIGQKNYLEFTRDGNLYPEYLEKASTLKRVAYVCHKGSLLRRTWKRLDSPHRSLYEDKPLLQQLNNCHFAYLNQNLQVLPEWQKHSPLPHQPQELFPKAIQINLTLSNSEEINLLFIVPRILYAAN